MAISRPTILLVHGAWHDPSCFAVVQKKLEDLSYKVVTASLPTVGTDTPLLSVNDDVAAIRGAILPLMDQGEEILIVAHSYGGIPACASTEGHGIEERAEEGKLGGIKSNLFVTAFALPEKGMNLLQAFGGTYPAFMIQKDGYAVAGPGAKYAFYKDLLEKEAEIWTNRLRKSTLASFETPVNYVASDLKIPSTYLVCEMDVLIGPALQEGLAAGVPGMRVERCASGHSPFLSQPDRLIEVIVQMAEE